MKKLLFSTLTAFAAAVMEFRCRELGAPAPAGLVAASLFGVMIQYLLFLLFPDKKAHKPQAKKELPPRRCSFYYGVREKDAETPSETRKPFGGQTIILKGEIAQRASEDEIRAFYEGR
jgi:hypothetical protein